MRRLGLLGGSTDVRTRVDLRDLEDVEGCLRLLSTSAEVYSGSTADAGCSAFVTAVPDGSTNVKRHRWSNMGSGPFDGSQEASASHGVESEDAALGFEAGIWVGGSHMWKDESIDRGTSESRLEAEWVDSERDEEREVQRVSEGVDEHRATLDGLERRVSVLSECLRFAEGLVVI